MSAQKIRVRATGPGLYGHLREAGSQFHLASEEDFHPSWMEHVDEDGRPVEKSPVLRGFHEREIERLETMQEAAGNPETAARINEHKMALKRHGHKPRPVPSGDELAPVEQDPANPRPGLPDPGEAVRTEAIVDKKLEERGKSSGRPSERKAI